MEKALEHKLFALGCFIDIDGAFNNMTFRAIAKACRDHGIDETTIGWIMRMLKCRVVSAYLGTSKVTIYVRKGCPQAAFYHRFQARTG